MKKEFEMPEIKVSKFNVENIVTDSVAVDAAKAVLGTQGVTTEYTTVVDFNDMFAFN